MQSAPSFATKFNMPVPAVTSLVKAEQADAAGQWQQVCTFAQACIATANHDERLRSRAKRLLANALFNLNQLEQALMVCIELHQAKPNDPDILKNIGLLLTHLAKYEDAIKCFQRSIELAPENVEFYMGLALAFFKNRDFAQARVSYQKAANLDPKHAKARFGIAWSIQSEGFIEEAMVAYEQVLALDPGYVMALSNMIFINHSVYPFNMDRQMELVRRFGAAMNDTSIQTKHEFKPHIPLRVGIVSADFCRHVVCSFLESTLNQLRLDSQLGSRLTLVAYSNQSLQDECTVRLHKLFDSWRRVDEWSDLQLVEQIKQDKIDILIDLSGHTKGGRFPVFAKKPAPLQVSWLGYWGSTGLSAMDYILADPICAPEQEEHLFIEKVWRLPSLRYCFSVPEDAPEVSAPPCLQNSKVVFGCYQTSIKINDGVLKLWAQILAACPMASLRIQSFDFSKPELKERFIERMSQAGLDIDRVHLVEGVGTKNYLASYAEVDILLDTFPYPGGTTTAEALWMGVPTLTFATAGMLGRQGEAMMVNAGLSDWVAHSEAEYVQKAMEWANADEPQRQALATLRAGMREQVRLSPVFNAKKFAVGFVDALYGMWQEKCDEHGK